MLKDMTTLQILLAVAGISALIAWHELGHYLAARIFGMRVVRYALGIGPKVWGVEKGGIQYQISALPFGGFVQIFGMTPFEPGAIQDPRAFINAPRWQRIVVYVMGPAFNYILAAGLFFCFFLFFPGGTVHVVDVVDQSAAQEAGLLPGDVIYGVDGRALRSEADFLNKIQGGGSFQAYVRRDFAEVEKQVSARLEEARKVADEDAVDGEQAPADASTAGAADAAAALDEPAADGGVAAPAGAPAVVDDEVSRLGALLEQVRKMKAGAGEPVVELNKTVTPKVTEHGMLLGVSYRFAHDATVSDVSLVDVAVASVVTCYTQSVATLRAVGRKFRGDDSVKFEGPLGIGKHITKAVERGPRDLLWILALLSVTLGLLNLLPVPALDGIKILILLVESVFRRNISPVFQLWLNALGLLALIGLMVVMTFYDAAELLG